MQIRKFYDPAATEPAGNPTEKIELTNEPVSWQEVIDSNRQEDEPEEVIAPKEEPVAEPAKEEVVTQAAEPIAEQIVQQPVAQDWRELVKQQDQKEVYKFLDIDEQALSLSKELGSDPFVTKMLNYRKEHGNLTPFIEAATKNWDDVSDLELLRDDLKRQYPNLSKEKFEKLAKAEIDRRFLLGEDALEEEVELAQIRLETEGDKIRQLRKKEQQEFLDSVKPVDYAAESKRIAEEAEAKAQKEFEFFKNIVESHPLTTKLMTEKNIVLGEGEQSFKYTVNPASIKEKTFDVNRFYNQFWEVNGDGNQVFNIDKWNRVVAYAENPLLLEKALINHGISLGTKEIIDGDLGNATPPKPTAPQVKQKSLARAFMEEGRPVSLEEIIGG